jgi:hypothetical protein
MKNYLEKNKSTLNGEDEIFEYERKQKMSEVEYCTDTQVMIEQFTHFYNLFAIFDQKRIDEYCDFLIKNKVEQELINNCKNKAIQQSQWGKASFIESELISKGKTIYNMKNRRC